MNNESLFITMLNGPSVLSDLINVLTKCISEAISWVSNHDRYRQQNCLGVSAREKDFYNGVARERKSKCTGVRCGPAGEGIIN